MPTPDYSKGQPVQVIDCILTSSLRRGTDGVDSAALVQKLGLWNLLDADLTLTHNQHAHDKTLRSRPAGMEEIHKQS